LSAGHPWQQKVALLMHRPFYTMHLRPTISPGGRPLDKAMQAFRHTPPVGSKDFILGPSWGKRPEAKG
jgi:hypothetical protein